ncbi:hypothetical protein DYB25_000078 [Aphanomyces astaci]|uniref:Protein kinase domain-containing protein n=1 Tax=Aphanomyces astaci TaxID=112090 RepID=A0A397CCV4_APHAT|nr:hypothetical protein DYB36_002075 [Aphanomyces astaci]RHY15138.1 hypothetical protein DYB25_000078 [Aphanomyces astaci]RHY44275.1 hypothetical protein DYB30_002060 [Aphanomyces astaci]RHY61746.1 hypothetical protein DYB38_002483 [Aphanomyces astaci]RHY72247.1 hypothetical protein DYB34_001519 [Aphanomyces astaci]
MHRYTISNVLADALYGKVHLCRDRITGDSVAIKCMCVVSAATKVSTGGLRIQEDVSMEKHVNQTLDARGGHPHILRMRTAFVEAGYEHFVLDFCALGELYAVLDEAPGGLFGNDRASRYFRQIVSGVRFLHQSGFAHRDLSLENVLVDGNDNCQVCDFGLAASSSHLQAERVGKSFYMAPEVVANDAVYDASKADVWSLGMMLFVMLTGQPMFDVAEHSDDRFHFLATKGLRRLVTAWNLDSLVTAEAMSLLQGMLTVDPALSVPLVACYCMSRVEPDPGGSTASSKDDEVQSTERTGFHVVSSPEAKHSNDWRPSFLTETILAPHTLPPEATHTNRLLANVLKKLASHNDHNGQETKSKYRALIQKAAQRTIMIVRAKHSAQTVQKITVRFSNHQPTDLPRTVKLPLLKEKIVCHNRYDDSRKSTVLFRQVFESSPELEAIVKDMFWYIVSSEFQVRVMEKLPDAMSQLLFLALHDAFPISRYLFDDDVRKKLITICYSCKIAWEHWLPELSMQSQRKSAGLHEFPALRNRVRRAERLEKIKTIEIQNHQKNVKLMKAEDVAEALHRPQNQNQEPTSGDGATNQVKHPLPVVSQRLKSLERATYSLRNSPLITTFLKRHNLEHNAKVPSTVATKCPHVRLGSKQALHQKGAPMQRKRPVLDANSYNDLVTKFEAHGKQLKAQYASEKAVMLQQNEDSKALYAAAQKHLSDQYHTITSRSRGVHELSNMLVCKAQGMTDAMNNSKQQLPAPQPPGRHHHRSLGTPRRTNAIAP